MALTHAGYRPARQNRSAVSEQKLVAAAERLFAERGYAHTKISDIIRESGISTGSFYHRFSDKEGLLRVMMDRFIAEAGQIIADWGASAAEHETLEATLTSLAGVVFDTITARLGVYRAMQEKAQTDPGYWRHFASLGQAVVAEATAATVRHRGEITAADPDAAIRNAVQVILLLIIQTRLGAGVMFPKGRDEFIAIVVQAALGVLQPGRQG